ncbi:cytochrome [Sesamum angolense]|uniref:Cytochrome n=1 Tax=Sesamum angolense TaxID=2727404 RepID=A0AAE2BYA4_9LAMI|nr:cytochrome [Sesamum angolense]
MMNSSSGGLAWALSKAQTRPGAAIPGPSGFPLLGFGSFLHKLLDTDFSPAFLKSFKAESLMAFSVGFTRFIISSNPETAKEILNSLLFADRLVKEICIRTSIS